MTETNASQTQQKAPQLEMLEAWFKDMARLEEQNRQSAERAIDEVARLWKESLGYTGKLSAEWRKQWVESARRMGEMMGTARGA